MSFTNGSPVNTRTLRDANFIVNIALPNAANTVNTNGFDLVQATPYPTINKVICQIITTAGNGANNKNVNIILQDSADNVTFANIGTPNGTFLFQMTDNNGGGYAAYSNGITLPPFTRRYVRAQATGEANGGNSANGTLSLQLLF